MSPMGYGCVLETGSLVMQGLTDDGQWPSTAPKDRLSGPSATQLVAQPLCFLRGT